MLCRDFFGRVVKRQESRAQPSWDELVGLPVRRGRVPARADHGLEAQKVRPTMENRGLEVHSKSSSLVVLDNERKPSERARIPTAGSALGRRLGKREPEARSQPEPGVRSETCGA